MDRAPRGPSAPGTRPGPPNLNDLTPEEREAILAQGWTAAEDGTLTPPADAGGFDAALGGVPATAPPAPPAPPPMMGGGSSMMGKQHPMMPMMGTPPAGAAPDTLNARIDFANPMGEATPKPFDVPTVTPPLEKEATPTTASESPRMLRAQLGPDLKAAAGKQMSGTSGGGSQGRVGRRMQSRNSSSTRYSPRRGR